VIAPATLVRSRGKSAQRSVSQRLVPQQRMRAVAALTLATCEGARAWTYKNNELRCVAPTPQHNFSAFGQRKSIAAHCVTARGVGPPGSDGADLIDAIGAKIISTTASHDLLTRALRLDRRMADQSGNAVCFARTSISAPS